MTRKSKRKAMRPKAMWNGICGTETCDRFRRVSLDACYDMSRCETEQLITWLQRALEWQRGGR